MVLLKQPNSHVLEETDMPETELRKDNIAFIQSRPQLKRNPNIVGHVSLTFGDTTFVGYVGKRTLLAGHLGIAAVHGVNASEALIALAAFGLKAYISGEVPDVSEIERSVGLGEVAA